MSGSLARRWRRVIDGNTLHAADNNLAHGYFLWPVVIFYLSETNRLWRKEIGSIVAVHAIDSLDEVIKLASSTEDILAFSLVTGDLLSVLRFAHETYYGIIKFKIPNTDF